MFSFLQVVLVMVFLPSNRTVTKTVFLFTAHGRKWRNYRVVVRPEGKSRFLKLACHAVCEFLSSQLWPRKSNLKKKGSIWVQKPGGRSNSQLWLLRFWKQRQEMLVSSWLSDLSVHSLWSPVQGLLLPTIRMDLPSTVTSRECLDMGLLGYFKSSWVPMQTNWEMVETHRVTEQKLYVWGDCF